MKINLQNYNQILVLINKVLILNKILLKKNQKNLDNKYDHKKENYQVFTKIVVILGLIKIELKN